MLFYITIYFVRSATLLLTGNFGVVVQLGLVDWSPQIVLTVLFVLFIGPIVIGSGVFLALWAWRRPGTSQSNSGFAIAPWIGILGVLLVILISIVMFWLRVGITIAPTLEPLPFRMTGLLFYTRLLIAPVILAMIACKAQGGYRWIIGFLLVMNVLVVAVTSGSRLLVVLHALALLWMSSRLWIRLSLFAGSLLVGLNIASRGRDLWLAEIANSQGLVNANISASKDLLASDGVVGSSVISLYGSTEAVSTALNWSTFVSSLFEYIQYRALGLPELIMSASAPRMCSGARAWDGLLALLPLGSSELEPCYSIREVLRLPETSPGGFSVDFLGTLWLSGGSHTLPFIVLCLIVGIALGLSFSAGRQLEVTAGTQGIAILCLVIATLLLFESRYFVLISFSLGLAVIGLLLRWFVRVRPGSMSPALPSFFRDAKNSDDRSAS